MVIDIIGDIHGHADALIRLLALLGYHEDLGVFHHPNMDRTAVFVGDFIDRGPDIVLTLEIVRRMVEHGNARAVLGNHEYNALCFHHAARSGGNRWLRPRSDKNIQQHLETLYQFRHLKTRFQDHLGWFAELPVYLDLGNIRIVHAAWDRQSIDVIRQGSQGTGCMTTSLLVASADRESPEHEAVEKTLKGIETELPQGAHYYDKDGHDRHRSRVAWWIDWEGKRYRDILFPKNGFTDQVSAGMEQQVPEEETGLFPGYHDSIPVFFGHYWLSDSEPYVQADNVCCVDYSIARGGRLAAYTWSGEKTLRSDRFTLVR